MSPGDGRGPAGSTDEATARTATDQSARSTVESSDRAAFDEARELVHAGVPIFVARRATYPDGTWRADGGNGGCGYWLPKDWQSTPADWATVEDWRPGDALGAVMGHQFDLLDVDPRHGGDDSRAQLVEAGLWPTVYAASTTPSGGTHEFIVPLGTGSRDGVRPGLDVKGGRPDGTGRGFAWIAPTVKLSKVTGEPVAYRWTTAPMLEELDPADDSGAGLAEVVRQALNGTNGTRTTSTSTENFFATAGDKHTGPIVDGQRHSALVSYAGYLRRRGVGLDLAELLMRTRWADCAQPPEATAPLPVSEALDKLRDAYSRYEAGAPDLDVEGEHLDADALAQRVHERAVLAELRTLRARDEARGLLASEKAGEVPEFDLGTLAEVLARPAEPAHRVEGLIPSSAGTLVVAQRKTGKSTLMLNLARSLLLGEDFLGRYSVVPVEGTVAVLNFEVSAAQLARWAADVGVPAERLLLVNLRGRRNPLSHAGDRERLAGLLRSHGVEALLVDPFGRAYTGVSQNDPGEVGAFLADLDRWARGEVGAKDVVLAAHAGWNGERTRGSSALEDWCDVFLTMTRGSDEGDESSRYLRAEGRDVLVEEDRLEFDPSTRLLSLSGTGSRKVAARDKQLDELLPVVLDAVRRGPGGCSGYRLDQVLRETGLHARKGDGAKAAQLGVSRGLLRVEQGSRGANNFHLPHLPATSPGDVPPPPPPPFRGEVGGGVGEDLLTTGEVVPATCSVHKTPTHRGTCARCLAGVAS